MTKERALRRGLAAGACALVVAALGGGAGGPAVARAASGPERQVVAHRAGGRVVAASRLPTVRTTGIGHPAAEPTLGVAGNGDVFYAAATPGQLVSLSGIDVLRSSDRGRSWDVASPRVADQHNVHVSTGDPYVYVDRTKAGSRVFTVDLQGYVCSLLSFSDDGGRSWTTNPLGCGRPVNDHQTLFAGRPVEGTTVGYPKIVYYCYQDVASSTCSKSLDGGLTFVPAGEPSFSGFDEDGTFCGGLHGHGYAGPDGTVYIPKGHCGFPWLAISKDEGATWTRVQVAELASADHEASVAADRRGNVYYAYIGIDLLPYLVVSRDGGQTWGRPMMVGRPGVVEASLPSIDVGRSGLVAVAYMGTKDRGGDDYTKVEWDGYVTATRSALAGRPLFYSVSVNDPADPLLRGRCPQTKCGPVYDFIDVVVAPDDAVWGAFVDGCVAACVDVGAPNDGNAGLASEIRVPR
jgi:hypothetical protein